MKSKYCYLNDVSTIVIDFLLNLFGLFTRFCFSCEFSQVDFEFLAKFRLWLFEEQLKYYFWNSPFKAKVAFAASKLPWVIVKISVRTMACNEEMAISGLICNLSRICSNVWSVESLNKWRIEIWAAVAYILCGQNIKTLYSRTRKNSQQKCNAWQNNLRQFRLGNSTTNKIDDVHYVETDRTV